MRKTLPAVVLPFNTFNGKGRTSTSTDDPLGSAHRSENRNGGSHSGMGTDQEVLMKSAGLLTLISGSSQPLLSATGFVSQPLLSATGFVSQPLLSATGFVSQPLLSATGFVSQPLLSATGFVSRSSTTTNNSVGHGGVRQRSSVQPVLSIEPLVVGSVQTFTPTATTGPPISLKGFIGGQVNEEGPANKGGQVNEVATNTTSVGLTPEEMIGNHTMLQHHKQCLAPKLRKDSLISQGTSQAGTNSHTQTPISTTVMNNIYSLEVAEIASMPSYNNGTLNDGILLPPVPSAPHMVVFQPNAVVQNPVLQSQKPQVQTRKTMLEQYQDLQRELQKEKALTTQQEIEGNTREASEQQNEQENQDLPPSGLMEEFQETRSDFQETRELYKTKSDFQQTRDLHLGSDTTKSPSSTVTMPRNKSNSPMSQVDTVNDGRKLNGKKGKALRTLSIKPTKPSRFPLKNGTDNSIVKKPNNPLLANIKISSDESDKSENNTPSCDNENKNTPSSDSISNKSDGKSTSIFKFLFGNYDSSNSEDGEIGTNIGTNVLRNLNILSQNLTSSNEGNEDSPTNLELIKHINTPGCLKVLQQWLLDPPTGLAFSFSQSKSGVLSYGKTEIELICHKTNDESFLGKSNSCDRNSSRRNSNRRNSSFLHGSSKGPPGVLIWGRVKHTMNPEGNRYKWRSIEDLVAEVHGLEMTGNTLHGTVSKYHQQDQQHQQYNIAEQHSAEQPKQDMKCHTRGNFANESPDTISSVREIMKQQLELRNKAILESNVVPSLKYSTIIKPHLNVPGTDVPGTVSTQADSGIKIKDSDYCIKRKFDISDAESSPIAKKRLEFRI